jgi:SPFH domain / Band 7 family
VHANHRSPFGRKRRRSRQRRSSRIPGRDWRPRLMAPIWKGRRMPLFFFTVEQQERAIVERFGKFVRVAGPGLQRKSPFVESVAGRMSLPVEQLNADIETQDREHLVFDARDTAAAHDAQNRKCPARHQRRRRRSSQAACASHPSEMMSVVRPGLRLDRDSNAWPRSPPSRRLPGPCYGSECRSRHPSAWRGARARCTSSSGWAPTRLRPASESQCRA